jgi:hypothetical protein
MVALQPRYHFIDGIAVARTCLGDAQLGMRQRRPPVASGLEQVFPGPQAVNDMRMWSGSAPENGSLCQIDDSYRSPSSSASPPYPSARLTELRVPERHEIT